MDCISGSDRVWFKAAEDGAGASSSSDSGERRSGGAFFLRDHVGEDAEAQDGRPRR